MEPSARFDDARSGRSFALSGLTAQLVARQPQDVVDVLRQADDHARSGRWVAGWVAYEAAPGLDPSLRVRTRTAADPLGPLPLAWFGVFAGVKATEPLLAAPATWALDVDADAHRRAVEEIRCRIAAGLTYQVNLTARAHATVADPGGLYAALAAAQGGQYNALIASDEYVVACASPELFFDVDGRHLSTRPMKGTQRRGRWTAEDDGAAEALRHSAKEQAENVMVVDLLRNDIGRIAEYGSVRVPALFDTERYPGVWQLTSTVDGRLRAGVGLAEVFAALFPSGSVTGAPKRATMGVIAELEDRPRGVYCGAVGVCRPGEPLRARFAVGIRTATVRVATGYGEFGTGGGITWGSDAGAEWAELQDKAAILAGPPPITGLFETFRSDSPNVAAHLDRLAASARYFGIELDRPGAEALAARPPGERVRLVLGGDGGLQVETGALPAAGGTVRLAWSSEPVHSEDARLFHKVLDRQGYERRRAAGGDVDDVILLNERGEVTETTIANLAVRIAGEWCTPALGCGVLPGVERARLLAAGELVERVIHQAQISATTELAVVNSLRGWRPARLR